LGLEFNLTDIELQRLYDASPDSLPAAQNTEGDAQTL